MGRYLSDGKLGTGRLIFNKILSSESNGCHMDHVRHSGKPKGRTRLVEKAATMQCKENFTFCDNDCGNNSSHALKHHCSRAPAFTCLISFHSDNIPGKRHFSYHSQIKRQRFGRVKEHAQGEPEHFTTGVLLPWMERVALSHQVPLHSGIEAKWGQGGGML